MNSCVYKLHKMGRVSNGIFVYSHNSVKYFSVLKHSGKCIQGLKKSLFSTVKNSLPTKLIT